MPRQGRHVSSQGIYHILQRGIDKRDLFLDDSDFRFYLKCINATHLNLGVTFYGYCLMSNHVHLLIQVGSLNTMAQVMQFIAQDYARWHNYKYERTGHLFDNRYRSHPLEDHAQALSTLHYIHQNPLRSALASTCDLYPWSSHTTYLHSYDRQRSLTHLQTLFVNTAWIHHFYPTIDLYQQYMAFERFPAKRLHLTTQSNSPLLLLDGPVSQSDQSYYCKIKSAILQHEEESLTLDLENFTHRKHLASKKVSLNACRRYWVICRIYEQFPTTTRQLGRVLGFSHNLVLRALASESMLSSKKPHTTILQSSQNH